MSYQFESLKKPFIITIMSAIISTGTYIVTNRIWKQKQNKNHKENQWKNYLQKLDKIKKEVERKTTLGYSLEKRLPTQLELLQLSEECLTLTEELHGKGKGNYTAFYTFFYNICEVAQTTFYAYNNLTPLQQSHDGFVTFFSGETRAKLQQNYMATVRNPFLAQGGMWAGGRSAIDNTTLSTVMPKNELNTILASNGIKRTMLNFLRSKQKKILQNVSDWLGFDLTKVSADLVRKTLSDDTIPFRTLKINPDTLSFKSLLKYGSLIEDWGQIPDGIKNKLWEMSKERHASLNPNPSPSNATNLTQSFAMFTKSNPGEFITASDLKIKAEKDIAPKQLHWLAQTTGLWSNQLGALSRTHLENLTPIRYFPISWVRRFALEDINEQGHKVVIRDMNRREYSLIRPNQAPYQLHHCMSMSSSGFPEGLNNHSTLLYKLGIPLESGARLTNLYCDIEKVLREVYLLNPKASPGHLSTADTYLTVGQNATSGSSIQQTQHTHISEGTIKDFPIYNTLPADKKVKISVDKIIEIEFIPVGKTEDSFFLKMLIDDPVNENFIEFMISMKMLLLKNFGGTKNIDFHLHVIPDGQGKFMVIFAPLIRFERTTKDNSFVFTNPVLGKSDRDLELPTGCINLSQGAGIWELLPRDKQRVDTLLSNGRELLGKLWDFAAKKGARDCILQFLDKYQYKSIASSQIMKS